VASGRPRRRASTSSVATGAFFCSMMILIPVSCAAASRSSKLDAPVWTTISRAEESFLRQKARLDAVFLGRPFLPTFEAQLRSATEEGRRVLYHYMIRHRFNDFLAAYKSIPPFPGYFDLVSAMPFDASGSSLSYFQELLSQATLVPAPADPEREILCAFVLLLHGVSRQLEKFIAHLSCPDFIFILSIDARAQSLRTALKNTYAHRADVFFVEPQACVKWGDMAQNYGIWSAVSGLVQSKIRCRWVSLNSAADLVIHSRDVVRQFLRRYDGRAEFYENEFCQSARIISFFVHDRSGCLLNFRWRWIAEAINAVFQNWTKIGCETMRWGSTWWTISFDSAKAILKLIRDDPELILRLGFSSTPDEALVPTLMGRLGRPSSRNLRYMRWQGGPHPLILSRPDVATMHKGPFLFARKVGSWNDDVIRMADDRSNGEQTFPDVLTEKFILNRTGKWNGWMPPQHYEVELKETPYVMMNGVKLPFL
jgi:hypothetical protein